MTVGVADEVLDPLPTSFRSVAESWNEDYSWNESSRMVTIRHPSALWRFQDNDTVVLGTYSLRSNLHDVEYQAISVSPMRQDAVMRLGGITFTVEPVYDSMAIGYYLGYNRGTHFSSLPLGIAVGSSYPHNASMVLTRTQGGMEPFSDVRARVVANMSLTFHGRVTLRLDPNTYEGLSKNLEYLQRKVDAYAYDFGPGNRLGQVTYNCPVWAYKAYDPCMNPFKVPVP